MNNLDKFFLGFNREILNQQSDNYPPFNIVKLSKTKHQIELAVAGFRRDQLHMQVHQRVLTVQGTREANPLEDDAETFPQYLYRGISRKAFKRQFNLADNVKIFGAELTNGVLIIQLESSFTEANEPITISIKE